MRSIALALVIALAGDAAAQSIAVRDTEVRAAIRDYEALSYGTVIPRLVKALARPELIETDRRAALAYLARSYAIFQRRTEAESTFDELLQRDATFAVADSESPRIREAYLAAKARRVVATPVPPVVTQPAPQAATVVTTIAPPASKTWLWVGAGAVVVAAAVVTLFILRPWHGDELGRPVPDAQLGRFDLP